MLLVLSIMPVQLFLLHYRTPASLYVSLVVLTVAAMFAAGPMLTLITESLPRHVRAGTLGTLYAVAVAVFGGSTQFMVAWLIGRTGSLLVPGWYSIVAAAVGLAAIAAARETAPVRAKTVQLTTASPLPESV